MRALSDMAVELAEEIRGSEPHVVEITDLTGEIFEVHGADPTDPDAVIDFGSNASAAEFFVAALESARQEDEQHEAMMRLPMRSAKRETIRRFDDVAHVLCLEGAEDPRRQVTVFIDPYASRSFGVRFEDDLTGPPWNLACVVVPYVENLDDRGLLIDICNASGELPTVNATLHRATRHGDEFRARELVRTIGKPANPRSPDETSPLEGLGFVRLPGDQGWMKSLRAAQGDAGGHFDLVLRVDGQDGKVTLESTRYPARGMRVSLKDHASQGDEDARRAISVVETETRKLRDLGFDVPPIGVAR